MLHAFCFPLQTDWRFRSFVSRTEQVNGTPNDSVEFALDRWKEEKLLQLLNARQTTTGI